MPGEKEDRFGFATNLNLTELIRLTRSLGLGGDRKCTREQLLLALENQQPLLDAISPIRKMLVAYLNKRWVIEKYRLSCPAKDGPDACYLCSDGQVVSCYLFGNNKNAIEEAINDEDQ